MKCITEENFTELQMHKSLCDSEKWNCAMSFTGKYNFMELSGESRTGRGSRQIRQSFSKGESDGSCLDIWLLLKAVRGDVMSFFIILNLGLTQMCYIAVTVYIGFSRCHSFGDLLLAHKLTDILFFYSESRAYSLSRYLIRTKFHMCGNDNLFAPTTCVEEDLNC